MYTMFVNRHSISRLEITAGYWPDKSWSAGHVVRSFVLLTKILFWAICSSRETLLMFSKSITINATWGYYCKSLDGSNLTVQRGHLRAKTRFTAQRDRRLSIPAILNNFDGEIVGKIRRLILHLTTLFEKPTNNRREMNFSWFEFAGPRKFWETDR